MKALRKPFKMRMRITGINHLIGEEFQSAAPFRQPQCAVERARVRHLARHPEVYSNLFRTVDILNESPNKALKYSCNNVEQRELLHSYFKSYFDVTLKSYLNPILL
jgi:hypothetical protein